MGNQVTGRATISVDGLRLQTKAGATFQPGGVKRTPVISDQGVAGYTEETLSPQLECTVIHKAGVSISYLNGIKDASIVFETDTGSRFQLQQAWSTGEARLTGGGDVAMTFNSITSEEI